MRKINCARCTTRRVTKPNRVGTNAMRGAFAELVGEDIINFNEDDLICQHCNAEVRRRVNYVK